MSAVYCEDLKLLFGDMTHPASDTVGFAVPLPTHWIGEFRQTSLSDRKCVDRPERDPGLVCVIGLHGREQIPEDWHSNRATDHSIDECADREEQPPTRHR